MIPFESGFHKVIYKRVQFYPLKIFLKFLHQARVSILKKIDTGSHDADFQKFENS